MMQCVLLAAGKGHRLNAAVTNKCLAKVNGQPLIDYSFQLLSPQIFDELIVVVGHNAKYIKNYIGNNYRGIKVTYVEQNPQLGIAHAVLVASPYINKDFMMCLSDEIMVNPKIETMVTVFTDMQPDCLCGVTEDAPENIKKAYTLQLDKHGQVTHIVEKPHKIFNKWKGTGLCLMKQTMLPVLKDLKPNEHRNEYEMGNWIQSAIDSGLVCRIAEVADANFNINELQDIQSAETYIKQGMKRGKP